MIIKEFDTQERVDYLTKILNNAESVTMRMLRVNTEKGDRIYKSWEKKLDNEIRTLKDPDFKQPTIWDTLDKMDRKKSFIIN